jgi:hypothetical protein
VTQSDNAEPKTRAIANAHASVPALGGTPIELFWGARSGAVVVVTAGIRPEGWATGLQ